MEEAHQPGAAPCLFRDRHPSMEDAAGGSPSNSYRIRQAALNDRAALVDLISRSARILGTARYSASQIEGALRGAFGVDTQLIHDGTYFVAEDPAGAIVGCGGWSRRRTLFGGDQRSDREAGELDPEKDAAKIRAFFVDPAHTRRGIATALLSRCEAEASRSGFSRFELMGTLTGVALYEARGYLPLSPVRYELGPGLTIEFLAMAKTL
jgi:GNAT superfamily N-acetyltransferase